MDLSGQSAEASLTVQQSDTAEAIGLGEQDVFPAVLATSRMVALMEIAAARLVRPLLKDGELGSRWTCGTARRRPSVTGSGPWRPPSPKKEGSTGSRWRPSTTPDPSARGSTSAPS